MPFLNSHCDILSSKITGSTLSEIVRNGLEAKRVVFYDFSLLYCGQEENRDSRFTTLSITPCSFSDTDQYFPSCCLFSLGSVKEFVYNEKKYVHIPYFSINFNDNKVLMAERDSFGSLHIATNDIVSYLLEVGDNNESILESNVQKIGDKYYKLEHDYLFVDIVENGTNDEIENFDLFIQEYDESTGEFRYIPLVEEIDYVFGGFWKEKNLELDIEVFVDDEIPNSIFCRHTTSDFNKNSVVFRNQGIINIEQTGHICSEQKTGFPKVYINKKEGKLGGNC